MEIIGEKINGTRQRVGRAVIERDADFIRDLAVKQAEAGAAYLDVNAGTQPDTEPNDLVWLVKMVQDAVDVPLCLDSPNPTALAAAIAEVRLTPMINSINGEPDRLENILPLVAERNCRVIALAMDGVQIPKTSDERMSIIRAIMAKVERYGIPQEHVYVDTLAMAIATDGHSGVTSLQTMRAVRSEFPQAHITCGLSNISFGLPARSWINMAFLTLAIDAGLDSAILDPMDRAMQAAILSAELVLGRDRFSRNYTRAYRNKLFA
ncbi:MAG: dihydropteroate synthase [Anaerolineales bacterium]|nr:dihydropteroate synthase [Anaerolineales bacterium]